MKFHAAWLLLLLTTPALSPAGPPADPPADPPASQRPAPAASQDPSPPPSTERAGEAPVELERIRGVEFARRGDEPLTADIYIPQGRGPFPAVLMIHGGGWMSGSKWNLLEHANYAARRGYTVVSINYRLAPAAKFPAQIHDCKQAVRWMRRNAERYRIDPQRIAAYGYSAGGHLAALLGTTDPDDRLEGVAEGDSPQDTRVAAVVAGGAPCEFQDLAPDSKVLAYFLGGTRAEHPETYRLASPTAHVSADDPPVFMFHGDADRLVPRQRGEALHRAITRAGGQCEFHVVQGKGHLGAFFDVDARRRAVDFLDSVLKPQSPQRQAGGAGPVDPAPSARPDTAGKDTAGKDTAGKDTAGKDTAGKDTAGQDTPAGRAPRKGP